MQGAAIHRVVMDAMRARMLRAAKITTASLALAAVATIITGSIYEKYVPFIKKGLPPVLLPPLDGLSPESSTPFAKARHNVAIIETGGLCAAWVLSTGFLASWIHGAIRVYYNDKQPTGYNRIMDLARSLYLWNNIIRAAIGVATTNPDGYTDPFARIFAGASNLSGYLTIAVGLIATPGFFVGPQWYRSISKLLSFNIAMVVGSPGPALRALAEYRESPICLKPVVGTLSKQHRDDNPGESFENVHKRASEAARSELALMTPQELTTRLVASGLTAIAGAAGLVDSIITLLKAPQYKVWLEALVKIVGGEANLKNITKWAGRSNGVILATVGAVIYPWLIGFKSTGSDRSVYDFDAARWEVHDKQKYVNTAIYASVLLSAAFSLHYSNYPRTILAAHILLCKADANMSLAPTVAAYLSFFTSKSFEDWVRAIDRYNTFVAARFYQPRARMAFLRKFDEYMAEDMNPALPQEERERFIKHTMDRFFSMLDEAPPFDIRSAPFEQVLEFMELRPHDDHARGAAELPPVKMHMKMLGVAELPYEGRKGAYLNWLQKASKAAEKARQAGLRTASLSQLQ